MARFSEESSIKALSRLSEERLSLCNTSDLNRLPSVSDTDALPNELVLVD